MQMAQVLEAFAAAFRDTMEGRVEVTNGLNAGR